MVTVMLLHFVLIPDDFPSPRKYNLGDDIQFVLSKENWIIRHNLNHVDKEPVYLLFQHIQLIDISVLLQYITGIHLKFETDN